MLAVRSCSARAKCIKVDAEKAAHETLPSKVAAAVEQQAAIEGVLVPTVRNTRFESKVSVLSESPLIFKISDFISEQACQKLIDAAERSPRLAKSQVGGAAAGRVQRTSSTLAISSHVVQEQPELHEPLSELLHSTKSLFQSYEPIHGSLQAGFKRPRSDGTLALEMPQIARYTTGERFDCHEDAFPLDVARESRGYNRLCTVLVYLNDECAPDSDGDISATTTFDAISLVSRPVKASCLVFFPAFADGTPDSPRMQHTAQPASDRAAKYVSQVWLSADTFSDTTPNLRRAQQKRKPKKGFGKR